MKYSVSDWRSKLGKKADMRTTVITAAERFQMLEKNMPGSKAYKEALDATSSTESLDEEQKHARIKELLEKKKKRNMLVMSGSHNPPVAGVLSGHEWNKFIKEAWSEPDNIIIHTVIMPPGKDPRQVSFAGARIRSSKVRSLGDEDAMPRTYPDTCTGPTTLFEAFVESDCIPAERFVPNHFLVANTKTMAIKQIESAEATAAKVALDQNSVWYQEAVKYSGRVTN